MTLATHGSLERRPSCSSISSWGICMRDQVRTVRTIEFGFGSFMPAPPSSGFLAAVPKDAVFADEFGKKRWPSFADLASKHSRVPKAKLELPMYFCGRVIGGDTLGVYALMREKTLKGLMFVSAFTN